MKTNIEQHIADYNNAKLNMDKSFREIMSEAVRIIKELTKNNACLIGNMVYSTQGTELVYCYYADYKNNRNDFYPVYDIAMSGEYGWYEPQEIINICKVICKSVTEGNYHEI